MILILHNMQLGSIGVSTIDDPTNVVKIYLGANYIPTEAFLRVEASLKPFIDNFKKNPVGDKGPSIQVFKGKVKETVKGKDGKETEKDVEKYFDIDELDAADVRTVADKIEGSVTGQTILEHTYKESNRNLVSKRLMEIDRLLAEREKARQTR